MKNAMQEIQTFFIWIKIWYKIKRLGCPLLMDDFFACRDEVLLLMFSLYKFQGKTKQERQEDCIGLIKQHFKTKEKAEAWPIGLDYQLGGMRRLTEKIEDFQPVVNVLNHYDTILD